MSVFGGNQVGKIISGDAYGASADLVDFITNGTDGEVQVFSGDGSALTEGPFKILQRTDSAVGGVEYTEVINPKEIESISAKAYQAPVQRRLKVTGFTGTIRANATYEVFIRLYNDGSLSPENFRMIPAFFVTPDDVSGLTFADILNEMRDGIVKSLARDPEMLFNITVDTAAGEFIVEGLNVSFVLGRKDGRPVEFDLQATVRSNGDSSNVTGNFYQDLTVETEEPGHRGNGTGNQIANLEWFLKGNEYSRYRDVAYPSNFITPYIIDPAGTYHVVNISYFRERTYTNVERQHRYAYIVFDAADVVATNALIADLEVATGLTIAPIV